MTEQWKDVAGYEGLYQVSNLGRIRNRKKAILSQRDCHGYLRVSLCKNNSYKHFRTHILVLQTFGRKKKAGEECRHMDGTRKNNKISNLQWGTRKENMQDQKDHKTLAMGERSGKSKLRNEDIAYIRKHYVWRCQHYGSYALGRMFKTRASNIMAIINNVTWKHLT